MGFPLQPNVPQPLVALQDLTQACWAGRLPNVTAGQTFWASVVDAPSLIAAALARPWVQGTDGALPPPEPRYMAHGAAGLGAGTSNASR